MDPNMQSKNTIDQILQRDIGLATSCGTSMPLVSSVVISNLVVVKETRLHS
jgi:hypothetical protein